MYWYNGNLTVKQRIQRAREQLWEQQPWLARRQLDKAVTMEAWRRRKIAELSKNV